MLAGSFGENMGIRSHSAEDGLLDHPPICKGSLYGT